MTQTGDVYKADSISTAGEIVNGSGFHTSETGEFSGGWVCTLCNIFPTGTFGGFKYQKDGDTVSGNFTVYGRNDTGYALWKRPQMGNVEVKNAP